MAQNGCIICAPVVGKTVHEMLDQMQLAEACSAHAVELRLDHITRFDPLKDLQRLLKVRKLPVIVTYRPKWEGGEYDGDDETRLNTLVLAAELGAEFIDVELQVAAKFLPKLKKTNCRIIVSNHNYQNTPSAEKLAVILEKIQSTAADIIKLVTTANTIVDVAPVLQVLARSQVPVIGLVMGEKGLISRILSPKFGGFLTFGSLDPGKESAPGQPTLQDLKNIYGIDRLNRDTKIFGIVGNPVSHSKSPVIHNAAFKETKFNAVYVRFLVDNLADFLKMFNSFDFCGFSVTIPHKEAAIDCCDEVDSIAQAIGAVNTMVRRKIDGKLIGYNTDCEAAISAIEDELAKISHNRIKTSLLKERLFVIIGAGGAGKALAYGAKQRGARVVIANRNYERAKVLANLVGAEAIPLKGLGNYCPESHMILANTTAVGMHPNIEDTPIIKEALKNYILVFDAVYTPRITRLLKEAEESGAAIVSGLEMFIRQAAVQFKLFTGFPAPIELMRKVICESMQASEAANIPIS